MYRSFSAMLNTRITIVKTKETVKVDIKDLLIFKTLAKEKNITKTAEQLNYVQSNVTARIKKLEEKLGAKLFYRHPRG